MISFRVNGTTVTVQADTDTPLLWVLREELQLQGTKFGCGAGLCGACTVLIDGQASRTCILPVAAVADKAITTIEGLDGEHPVQRAWIENSVPQCGYCQSGQIMSAITLLTVNPSPSDADIKSAMAGNICRCGTYPRILAAIKQAAQSQQALQEESTASELYYDAAAREVSA